MRKILILLIGISIYSCDQKKETNTKSTPDKEQSKIVMQTENFDWLLGKWKRLNEEVGKETFENWKKISEVEYSGIGFTLQNSDTIKQEKIRLTKSDGNWNIEVKVPEETMSITFKGVSHSKNEFTCENNEIDFPNRIKYWKTGDRLNASVSNIEMEIPFEFEKLKK